VAGGRHCVRVQAWSTSLEVFVKLVNEDISALLSRVQASQVANIGAVEELLGNLDCADRYVRWALAVHEHLKLFDAVQIDKKLLHAIEGRLGRSRGQGSKGGDQR
jgi:hypothetical protein